jgi:hypothetical protein
VPDSNPMRREYRPLTEDEQHRVAAIKAGGGTFYDMIATCDVASADPRCLAIARTKVEEAVMWAVKGITG